MTNNIINSKLLESPNPFSGIIARSAWDDSTDVESINSHLTYKVVDLLHGVKTDNNTKIMLVQGQPGIGKTHFISRLRHISCEKNFLFVSVKPISSPKLIFSNIYRDFINSLMIDGNEKYNSMEKLVAHIISTALIDFFISVSRFEQLSQRNQFLLEKLQTSTTAILEIPNAFEIFKPIIPMTIKRIKSQYIAVDEPFLRVLFLTLDSNLREDAMRWLQGYDVDIDILYKLDVVKSINNETNAQRALYSIMTLSIQPILLCFDQLDSIYDRFHDPNVMVTFFDVLNSIYSEASNVVILLSIKKYIWDKLEKENLIKQPIFDKIEHIESLRFPRFDEIVEIISKRMNSIWNSSTIQPEYKTYPFTLKYIKELGESLGWNPRNVLKQLNIEFSKMKMNNIIKPLDSIYILPTEDSRSALGVQTLLFSQFDFLGKKLKILEVKKEHNESYFNAVQFINEIEPFFNPRTINSFRNKNNSSLFVFIN